MKFVPKVNAQTFLSQTNILTDDEIKQIIDICTFHIEMPSPTNTKVVFYIKTEKALPTKIYAKLANYPSDRLKIVINSDSFDQDYEKMGEYIQAWLKKNYPSSYVLHELLQSKNYSVVDGVMNILYVSDTQLENLKNVEKELLLFLINAHFDIKSVSYTLDVEKQNRMLEAENNRKRDIAKMVELSQKMMSPLEQYDKMFKVSGEFEKMNAIDESMYESIFNFSGEIISVKQEGRKDGSTRFTFVIYDYADGALRCSYRISNEPPRYKITKWNRPMPKEYVESFKVGDWVNIRAKIQNNQYTKFEVAGSIYRMCHAERPKHFVPHDDCKNKRVELLIHSNMTAYEGLDAPEKIYSHAKACGYNAVGVIERNNVQSIPDIFRANRKYPSVKPLYGCEFEIIDKHIPIVVNPIDKKIVDADYVVFDIETTGLYPEFDDLIEFGGIKFKNGEIVDHIDFFVKPTKPLTNVAMNLSHITNDMVENGLSQKDALLKIKEWIGNDVLIAHNGIKFDLNFLNKLCDRFDVEPIKNCLIDTLEISHAVNKKFSKHTLGTLVNKLHLEYNPLEAHRADKDSEYLLEVWKYFIKRLTQEEGITNIKDINNKLQTAALRASRRGYFVDVYVKNQKGLKNLFDLLSLSLTKQLYQKDDDEEVQTLTNGQPKLHFEDFEPYRDNLIICPSPFDGDIWESAISDTTADFEKKFEKYDYIFVAPAKNIEYLSVQEKITKADTAKALKKIIETGDKLNKKVCAVSDAYYLMPYERKFHEIYVYAKQLGGKRNPLYRHDGTTFVPDFHCLTTAEMIEAFKFIKDEKLLNQIVIDNTILFANSIEMVVPIDDREEALCKPDMPGCKEKLRDLVMSTAKRIYGDPLDKAILDRINTELNGIFSKGYEVIYWISHLLIEQSNKDGYLVGSRGSVGSSIIAFLSNISEVNPLPPHYVCPKCKHYEKYPDEKIDGFDLPPKKCPHCGTEMIRDGHNIPFSSFIGPKANKLPDIDLNFSGEYQAKAHNFIRDMFGQEHAFRAGTIGTVADKMAIGYVKSYYEQTDPNFKPNSALIEALGKKCEGVKRTTGQHPGGIVIVPAGHEITEFTPCNYPSNDKTKGWLTTHFEYHCLEKNLLKFDILGHDEPTILKHLHDITGVDPRTIPNHDDKVLQLFANSKSIGIVDENYNQEQVATMALPEFGTDNTRRIVIKTKPTCVGDLIRISGLSHGTGVWQGNAEELVEQGVKLSQTAACREDIFFYFVSCGMDVGHAFDAVEKIRKNKGISAQYEKEMIDAKVPSWYIDSCKKIEYLFPKAHATAYVLDAIRTAWYKVYYPTQFYAVWFSIRSDVFDIETVIKGPREVERVFKDYKARKNARASEEKLKNKQIDLIPIFEVCLEMFARGIKIKNIDINKSTATQFVPEGNTILAPFTSLDGLGKEVAESIVNARNESPFTSISDLKARTKLSTTLVEKLKALGALASLPDDEQISLF